MSAVDRPISWTEADPAPQPANPADLQRQAFEQAVQQRVQGIVNGVRMMHINLRTDAPDIADPSLRAWLRMEFLRMAAIFDDGGSKS